MAFLLLALCCTQRQKLSSPTRLPVSAPGKQDRKSHSFFSSAQTAASSPLLFFPPLNRESPLVTSAPSSSLPAVPQLRCRGHRDPNLLLPGKCSVWYSGSSPLLKRFDFGYHRDLSVAIHCMCGTLLHAFRPCRLGSVLDGVLVARGACPLRRPGDCRFFAGFISLCRQGARTMSEMVQMEMDYRTGLIDAAVRFLCL